MNNRFVVFALALVFLCGCRVDTPPERVVFNGEIPQPALESMYFEPLGAEQKVPGIIVLGGSEGGITSVANMARSFSSHGVGALAVAYFGHKDLPENLVGIQLEYVAQAIDELKGKAEIDSTRIGVTGASKGGELALLLASHYPDIRFVIGLSPGSVVFQGLNRDWSDGNGSSWQYQNKPLPFLPYASPWKVKGKDIADMYAASLDELEEYPGSVIPVEQINGPILLLTGVDDRMWPSSRMCNMVIERLEEHEFEHKYEHLAFPNAGHDVGYPHRDTTYGGTEEGNYEAGLKSQQAIREFLQSL